MRTRRNKDEIPCERCHSLTESSNAHPVTKTGNYCYDCYLTLKAVAALPPEESYLDKLRRKIPGLQVHLPGAILSIDSDGSISTPVDIRRDDHEPQFAHQVERDNPTPVKVVNSIDDAYAEYYYGRDTKTE